MHDNQSKVDRIGRKDLRNFGIATGSIVAGLFGVALPWLFEFSHPSWPWYVATPLILSGLIIPMSLRPVYRTWMKLGVMISRVTTPIVLGAAFFLVIMPFGITRRLLGKDSMQLKFDRDASSYRIDVANLTNAKFEDPY